MTEGQYKFSISLDDKQLKMDVAQAKKAFDELVKAAREAGVKIDESFDNPFDKLVPPTNLPRQTEAAAQGFNGLNMATQQLVRELPAATMGLNTFFLAVSNNLPIFADQIKAATEANKELVAQGKPTTSVFKQIIGSLFSWQSALIVGVTALSMYGKEIGNWVASLFKGKKAVDAMAEAERQLSETRVQGRINAQEEATNLMLTVKAMQDSSRTIEERRLAMQRLQSEYPSYFSNMSEEILLYGDLSSTINELVTNMYNMQRARTALDRLIENKETIEMLKGTAGYAEWGKANKAYDDVGREVKKVEVQVGGRDFDTVTKTKGEVEQYNLERETEKLLNNLEAQGGKAAELAETIRKQFNGDIDAFQKSLEAANTALEADVKPLVDKANDTERKRQAEEAKRRQEEEARQRRIAANAAKSKQDKLSEMQEQLAKDAAEARTDATIAAMEEGLEREKAQINAEYDAKAQLISEREAELKKLQKGEMTDEQQADLQALRDRNEQMRNEEIKAADEAYQRKVQEENAKRTADQQAWNEYLIAYGTFQERLKATQEKYATEIANAKNEGEKKMLEAERDVILAEFAVEAEGFAKTLTNKSIGELNKMLKDLEAQVQAKEEAFAALETSDSEEAQEYLKIINELKAKIAELKRRLGEAGKEVKDSNWTGAAQVLQGISSAASTAANSLRDVDEGLAGALSTIAGFTSVAGNLVSAIATITTATGALNTALGVIGLIAAAINAVLSVVSLFKDNYGVEETMRQFEELNKEIERTRELARIDSWKGTIFGEDAFGNFTNNLEVLRDASQALEESQKAIMERNKFGRGYDSIEKAIGSMQVKTRDRSGFAEAFGAKDEYANLGDLMPSLFGEDGNVTLKGLQELRDSDVWDKISEKNRNLIDDMIADWELYEEALEATNEYMSDIFGNLGASITDSLVDAFKNGTDAAIAMGDAVADVVEQIATDMAHAAFIQPLLEQAQDSIKALNKQRSEGGLSDEEYMRQLIAITDTLMDDAQATGEGLNAYLEQMQQMANEKGYDIFKSDSAERSAQSMGIAQASQDSVDELNGRMTAIQGLTGSLVEGQRQLINNSSQALTYLAGIESNTAELRQMRQDMGAMRKDISDISTRGIITR